MSQPSPWQLRVGIVIIGAGPAAVMLLERLLASHRRDTPELGLDVRLVDPHPPGGGRIWRRDQSPLLKLNSMFEDVAFFTDASCQIEGPVEPGPTLYEWVERVRAGAIDVPEWADEVLLREIAMAAPADFPTRRLNSAYLDWAYRETVRRAAPTVTVRWHEDRAIAVNEGGRAEGDPHTARLASGTELRADIVVHALGHNGSQPEAEALRLGEFAARHGLGYVAPAFTADVDLDWVGAGDDVIVRGMGLAAVDLTVLLTEGRGGRFEALDGGGLRYLPSGREPVLHLGSRRGVPYRSKITSQVVGEPVELEYLGPEFHRWIASLDRPLDFERDAWPRIAAEMLTGYHRELFTGYPERVVGTWAEFAASLREILAAEGGFESAELLSLIHARVPHPDDRFDLASSDRPLDAAAVAELPAPHTPPGSQSPTSPTPLNLPGSQSPLSFAPLNPPGSQSPAFRAPTGVFVTRDAGELPAQGRAEQPTAASTELSAEAVQQRVRAHIAQDLRQRTRQQHSATQALFLTLLFSYMSLSEVPAERWNARSRTRSLPKRWHSYFSYLASGPPGHRLDELLALSEAGVVEFLGGDVTLTLDDAAGQFVAGGSARTDLGLARTRVAARTLIDAWLPEARATASDNPLLRQLVASGQARELSVTDGAFNGSTGQIEVDEFGALPDSPRQFTVGPFTSLPGAGAFTRPGLNSLPFRVHDRRARSILEAVRSVAAARSEAREFAPAQ